MDTKIDIDNQQKPESLFPKIEESTEIQDSDPSSSSMHHGECVSNLNENKINIITGIEEIKDSSVIIIDDNSEKNEKNVNEEKKQIEKILKTSDYFFRHNYHKLIDKFPLYLKRSFKDNKKPLKYPHVKFLKNLVKEALDYYYEKDFQNTNEKMVIIKLDDSMKENDYEFSNIISDTESNVSDIQMLTKKRRGPKKKRSKKLKLNADQISLSIEDGNNIKSKSVEKKKSNETESVSLYDNKSSDEDFSIYDDEPKKKRKKRKKTKNKIKNKNKKTVNKRVVKTSMKRIFKVVYNKNGEIKNEEIKTNEQNVSEEKNNNQKMEVVEIEDEIEVNDNFSINEEIESIKQLIKNEVILPFTYENMHFLATINITVINIEEIKEIEENEKNDKEL